MQEFTAREYLKIDISNSFGNDKKDWNDRISWFDANEHHLESLIKTAETPALFYAGVQAWRDVNQGKPTGYPISLDACSSGIQLLAVLTGDVEAAKLCGVINTGHREDAYTNVYKRMVGKLGEQSKIKREDTKRAIMTSVYGSTAIPEEVFGTGKLLDTFYESMDELAPLVWELNKAFLDIWNPNALMYSWVLPDNFHVHIKVMTSAKETVHFMNEPFEVIRKVNQPKERGRSLGANTIHGLDGLIVREMARRCSYDPEVRDNAVYSLVRHGRDQAAEYQGIPDAGTKMLLTLWDHYKTMGYLSARILDYITNLNARYVDRDVVMELIDSLPAKPFELLAIHDCWRCLAPYGNDLRKQYVLQLAAISKSDLLSSLLSQITQREIKVPKHNPDMWKQILNSDYALS